MSTQRTVFYVHSISDSRVAGARIKRIGLPLEEVGEAFLLRDGEFSPEADKNDALKKLLKGARELEANFVLVLDAGLWRTEEGLPRVRLVGLAYQFVFPEIISKREFTRRKYNQHKTIWIGEITGSGSGMSPVGGLPNLSSAVSNSVESAKAAIAVQAQIHGANFAVISRIRKKVGPHTSTTIKANLYRFRG